MKKVFVILLSLFFASQAAVHARDLTGEKAAAGKTLAEVKAYVDKAAITIGDKVRYTIEADSALSAGIEFPSGGSDMGGFVVKDFGRDEDKKIGRDTVRRRQWYILDTYTAGPYVIPPQEVKVKAAGGDIHVIRSPEIFIDVKSVVPDGKGEEGLRDIKA
ncbi:MAG: hypothetical protein ABH883_04375, partial [Candidatus Omnitrophota bacterium]